MKQKYKIRRPPTAVMEKSLEINGNIEKYVGNYSLEFSGLESMLYMLIANGMRVSPYAAAAIWNTSMWKQRIELLDRFFGRINIDPRILSYWSDLKNFLINIGSDRNNIIHGGRMHETSVDGLVSEFVIEPNLMLNYGMERKSYRYSCRDIEGCTMDLRCAVNAVSFFNDLILGVVEIPHNIDEMPIRWRSRSGSEA